jgi:hypothetical protein
MSLRIKLNTIILAMILVSVDELLRKVGRLISWKIMGEGEKR